MLKKPNLRSKICNINFWIGNYPPPPFGTFPKIHPFWRRHPSLRDGWRHQNGWIFGNVPKGGRGSFPIQTLPEAQRTQGIDSLSWVISPAKGRMASPKLMNFRKVPNGLWPPPHFRKIMLRFSRQNCDKSAYVQYGGTVVYYMILFPMRCM